MKVTVEPQEKAKDIKYPCLMQGSTYNIVLFSEDGKGVLLQRGTFNNDLKIGEETSWDMNFFKPYNGKITLEND